MNISTICIGKLTDVADPPALASPEGEASWIPGTGLAAGAARMQSTCITKKVTTTTTEEARERSQFMLHRLTDGPEAPA